jgi:hypothetical protein
MGGDDSQKLLALEGIPIPLRGANFRLALTQHSSSTAIGSQIVPASCTATIVEWSALCCAVSLLLRSRSQIPRFDVLCNNVVHQR